MEEKTSNGLKEQSKRRKRINRIKTGFILSIFIWMILSMCVCVLLFIKVHSLEKQLGQIQLATTSNIEGTQNEAANYQEYDALGTEEQEPDPAETDENVISMATANIMGTSDTSNRAGEGDVLKVYLTFDDGPSSNTPEILDILSECNVKATFFVVGKEDETSKELYQRIVDEGHTLGMHSYSHKYSALYDSIDGFAEDFTKIQNLLYDVTGEECMLYRFPGGSSNRVSNTPMQEFISYLNQQGVTYFDWNVASGDATSQAYTADELVENVLSDVVKYKTSVVLMHDSETKATTVEALRPILEALDELGAEVLPIDSDTTAIQHITADSVQ